MCCLSSRSLLMTLQSCSLSFFFFFFKQKTAYEMRISDWSSDVCSSDLLKYFTLNIFDIFGNPSNLSNRTIGVKGGRFLLVPRNWRGTAPAGVTVYPAATTQLWILMRAFAQSDAEVRTTRAFQYAVRIIVPKIGRASCRERVGESW